MNAEFFANQATILGTFHGLIINATLYPPHRLWNNNNHDPVSMRVRELLNRLKYG